MFEHAVFDILAWLAAAAAVWLQARWMDFRDPSAPSMRLDYVLSLAAGGALGAYAFGTANLWLSGVEGFARSIEGALFGAIAAVELYKAWHGIGTRTGARFAFPFAIGVAVGRIGCYLSGMDDFTYGTPTTLPWGHNFGDGVLRHPVQLYESATMLAWAAFLVVQMRRRPGWILRQGFYATVGFYGLQRFGWEFLKPYAAIFGPLTLFHLLSVALALYAAYGLLTQPRPATR